ncbi:hypothetical protein GCM10007874_11370 [Labrys miyagiensis]|uniref:SGNH domain-containing protein n=1 Tax=Labrys miyagiensis TaxID=346912 RepID=A0ABQ6CCY6_9HYPH|nr:hypothetical protein GCM10007874_11370 [Labrys miyagiensis]
MVYGWLGVAGALIISACIFLVKQQGFYVWQAVFLVAGVLLVIASGSAGTPWSRVLAAKPLVYIGLISYPLYLWHWPVLVLARYCDARLFRHLSFLLIALSFVLAAVTYRYLERPIRRMEPLRDVSIRLFFAMAATSLVAVVGSVIPVSNLWYPPEVRPILDYANYDYVTDARVGECWIDPADRRQSFGSSCGFGEDRNGLKVAIWGDSHSGRLYPGLRRTAGSDIKIAEYVSSACPPIQNFSEVCQPVNEKAFQALENERPDIVILFARWTLYSNQYRAGSAINGLGYYVSRLKALGARVIVVGPFPVFKTDLPTLLLKEWSENKKAGLPVSLDGVPDRATAGVDRDLRAFAEKNSLRFFSLVDLLCSGNGCKTTFSDSPYDLITWDYGHLTTGGAEYVSRHLLDSIRDLARSRDSDFASLKENSAKKQLD